MWGSWAASAASGMGSGVRSKSMWPAARRSSTSDRAESSSVSRVSEVAVWAAAKAAAMSRSARSSSRRSAWRRVAQCGAGGQVRALGVAARGDDVVLGDDLVAAGGRGAGGLRLGEGLLKLQ